MLRYTGDSLAAVMVDGVPYTLDPKRLYSPDDAVVRAYPDRFEKVGGGVEQASRAPGERRNLKQR